MASQRVPNRFRILAWFNDYLEMQQVAVATYDDDEKLRELTFAVGPFTTAEDLVGTVLDWLAWTPPLL